MNLVMLAGAVEVKQQGTFVPLGIAELQEAQSGLVADITLRLYNEDEKMVWVVEFASRSGARLGTIRRMLPTDDDQAYLDALERHDVRPVDVEGRASDA